MISLARAMAAANVPVGGCCSPTLPAGLTGTMQGCFTRCEGLDLSAITIPEGVTSLKEAFSFCRNLSGSLTVPSTVTNMLECFRALASDSDIDVTVLAHEINKTKWVSAFAYISGHIDLTVSSANQTQINGSGSSNTSSISSGKVTITVDPSL